MLGVDLWLWSRRSRPFSREGRKTHSTPTGCDGADDGGAARSKRRSSRERVRPDCRDCQAQLAHSDHFLVGGGASGEASGTARAVISVV